MKEKLAQLAHSQWSGWIKYMFGKCSCHSRLDGIRIIPEWAVDRWLRQSITPYCDLSEEEKESDRKEADKFLALFQAELKGKDAEIKRLSAENKNLRESYEGQGRKP